MAISDELAENYRALHEGARETYESIAARIEETGDKHTAAEVRKLAAGGKPEARTEAPKERRAGNKAVTAEGK